MKNFDLRGKDYLTREEAARFVLLSPEEFDSAVRKLSVESFQWARTTVYRRVDLEAIIVSNIDAEIKAHIDEDRFGMDACRRLYEYTALYNPKSVPACPKSQNWRT